MTRPAKARCWRCGANDNESDDLRTYLLALADPSFTAEQIAAALAELTDEDRALVARLAPMPPGAPHAPPG